MIEGVTCRGCLENHSPMRNLYDSFLSENTLLYDYMSFICSIRIKNDDSLPSYLCAKCFDILLAIFKFSQTVKQNDLKLKNELRVKLNKEATNTNIETQNQKEKCPNIAIRGRNKILRNYKEMIDCERSAAVLTRQGYACDVCRKPFGSKAQRNAHQREHPASFRCKVCEKFFKFRSYLRVHQMSHSRGAPVSCDLCQSFYRDKQLLVRHIRTAHSGESYECSACGATFPHRSRLNTHMRGSHPAARDGGARTFPCSICLAVFKRPHHLKRHEKLHQNAKPYSCNICGRGFTQAQYLRVHQNEHSSAPKSACAEAGCKKTFSYTSSLRRHMLTHQSTRNWLCSSCGCCFSTADNLRRHQTYPNSCSNDLPPAKQRTILVSNHNTNNLNGVTNSTTVQKSPKTCIECDRTVLPIQPHTNAECKSHSRGPSATSRSIPKEKSLLLNSEWNRLQSPGQLIKQQTVDPKETKPEQEPFQENISSSNSHLWLDTFVPVNNQPDTIFYIMQDNYLDDNR